MSIQSQLQSQLAVATSGQASVLSIHDGDHSLECELSALHPLACSFLHFTWSTKSLAGATLQTVRAASDDLAARLTYLLEPIGPVEQDLEQCVVQMRSNPPQKDDDGTQYYELLVRRGGQISLCRYRKEPGNPRAITPAHVTHEVLVRLAGDFEAVVNSL